MSKTVDGVRHFVCKKCGQPKQEGIAHWKKKSQKDKNVCLDCVKRRKVMEQTRKEMGLDIGSFFGRYRM